MRRVVFMGTPEFAVPSLRVLAEISHVVAVYTRPDSVSRRGVATHPSSVKTFAAQLGIEIRQPPTLRDPAVQAELTSLSPEVIVVAAYGLILPVEVLEIPPLGCVNVHASLLPRWRGAAPVQRSILAGDTVTGVTIMRMEAGLDTGPYCRQAQVSIDEKAAAELTAELAVLGASELAAAWSCIAEGTCTWAEQDDDEATYAEKVGKSEVTLSPGLSADDALRRVRASTAQAAARAVIAGRGVTVTRARRAESDVPQGVVAASKSALLLGCADGSLAVERLRPDGKGEMGGADWVRGLRVDEPIEWTTS